MKKLVLAFLLAVVTLFMGTSFVSAKTQVVEKPDIKIYIDGELDMYSSGPIVAEGSTLLPLRELLVNLGIPDDQSHILWNGLDSSVTVQKDSIKVYLKVGDKKVKINGNETALEVAPVNYKGKVFVPAKFVAESFGKNVKWDSATRSVIIGSEPDSKLQQVIVRNAEEFVKSLGSNKRILLRPGTYDLSKIKQNDNKDKTVLWVEVSDGKELNLSNIENLTIEGSKTDKTSIRVSPRFAEIMNFKNCSSISIKNITAGHTPAEYECNASVLNFDSCADITISNSELYGCGSIGLETYNTKRLNCINTLIDHCSLRAIQLYDSDTINFSGCKILNHEAYSNIIYAVNSKNVTFEQCEMAGNNSFEWSFIELGGKSEVLIDKCKISNNSKSAIEKDGWDSTYFFKTIDYDGSSLSQITVRDSEISNNKCDYLYDNKDSVKFENCIIKDNVWKE